MKNFVSLFISFLLVFSVISFSQETDASKVFDNCIDKVGLITDDKNGFGSGFFINPNTFITNNHVVEGLDKNNIFIRLKDGSEIGAELIATDRNRDLAILVTDFDDNDYLYLILPDDVRQGDKVFALGNPSTSDSKVFEFNITDGIVNNIKYDTFKGEKLDIDAEVLLHSATINPGNSGGPLVTSNGAVAGVNSFYYNAGNNLYFAIHVGELIDFLKENKIKYKAKSRDENLITDNMSIYLIIGIGGILLIIVVFLIIYFLSKSSKKSSSHIHSSSLPHSSPLAQKQIVNPLSPVVEKTIQYSNNSEHSNDFTEATLIHQGKSYPVNKSNFIVGRDNSSNLVIEDTLASRRHFAIVKDGDFYTIKDLNSKNGTFLNGNKISVSNLKNSDIIKAGSSSLIFKVKI